jgi:predicted TIM-barrel fold metal-dependent hydrolase
VARIDAHAHFLPEDYRRLVTDRGLFDYPLPVADAEALDAHLRRHAIDAAIVSLSPPGVCFGDRGLARELARMVNEQTAALVRADPGRFAGLATLPLPDVEAALAELTHAFDVLGLEGVTLLSNAEGVYVGDERMWPLLEELDRRGAYVLVHPTLAPGADPGALPLWLIEYPFDTVRAAAGLVYGGAMERFPRIRWQLSHLGGGTPFLAGRIASLSRRDPASAQRAPAGALAYLRRVFYDTGLSDDEPGLRATLALAPQEQIVFGTDWPYAALPDGGDPQPGLDALGRQGRAAVDGFNVRALVPRLVR